MKYLTMIWDWFNGNKTLLGTACLTMSMFFPPHTFAHQALLYVGGVLLPAGLVHKAIKGVNNT